MKFEFLSKLMLAAAALGMGVGAVAQEVYEPAVYVGLSGGFHGSYLRLTDYNKQLYPTRTLLGAPVGSVWARVAFDAERHWAIRPEIAYTERGGGFNNVLRNAELGHYYENHGISDARYRMRGRYLDLRLPVMYRFNNTGAHLRPYVYVAPVLGLAVGGWMESTTRTRLPGQTAYSYAGTHVGASRANLDDLFFGAAAGLGLDWQFAVGSHLCSLGIEASYEHGFSDTYGNRRDVAVGHCIDAAVEESAIRGHRRFSGFEARITLGIPITVFGYHPREDEVIEYEEFVDTVVVEPAPVVVKTVKTEKPCYTLDEINTMMAKGLPVYGKTICAIDDAINFEFAKSTLDPASFEYLNKLAETLKRTNSRILVKGHTDNIGPAAANMTLSKERALTVMNYLVNRGVPRDLISYEYYGMSHPLTTNDTEEGRRLNRRVEFEILKK